MHKNTAAAWRFVFDVGSSRAPWARYFVGALRARFKVLANLTF